MRDKEDEGADDYLAILRMGSANCARHLIPIIEARQVQRLYVIRPAGRPDELAALDTVYVDTSGRSRIVEVAKTCFYAIRFARKSNIKGIISFNAFPYGLIAKVASLWARKPAHVAFVGTDAYRLSHRAYLAPVDWLLRRAQVVTVPGPAMAEPLVSRGYESARIHYLPHSIDIDRFVPPDGDIKRDIDLLFVGALIKRKQVDRIIRSLPTVIENIGPLTAVLIGEGPERSKLECLSKELGVEDILTFTGYIRDPAPWLRRSRLIVITSWWEGFPFVLVEGMCAGAIPVATRVGSIPDIIRADENGILLESDSPEYVAGAIAGVLNDISTEVRLRRAALEERNKFGYCSAVDTWEKLLDQL